jgi:MFS family permease
MYAIFCQRYLLRAKIKDRGANTDLLGRRYFLVCGNLICTIGHIIVGCAHSNNAIIAGLAVTGFGAANCQLAAYALSELLPNKWRHIGRYPTLFVATHVVMGSEMTQALFSPTLSYSSPSQSSQSLLDMGTFPNIPCMSLF